MAYSLHFHKTGVLDYLRDRGSLSRTGRLIIFTDLHTDLAVRADAYIKSADRRLGPNSKYFWYDIVFIDPESAQLRRYWFVIDDETAKYGVLRVVYAEETDPEAGSRD